MQLQKPKQVESSVNQVALAKIVENQFKEKTESMQSSHQALVKELNEKNRALQTNYNTLFEKHEIMT